MARVAALTTAPLRHAQQDWLRSLIVCGCALALILAGRALPF